MARAKHEITLFLHNETNGAWLVNESPLHGNPPTQHKWLPKSQCDLINRTVKRTEDGVGIIGTEVTLSVPEWLIEKHGLEALV